MVMMKHSLLLEIIIVVTKIPIYTLVWLALCQNDKSMDSHTKVLDILFTFSQEVEKTPGTEVVIKFRWNQCWKGNHNDIVILSWDKVKHLEKGFWGAFCRIPQQQNTLSYAHIRPAAYFDFNLLLTSPFMTFVNHSQKQKLVGLIISLKI